VTQVLAILPVLAVALCLAVSFVAWKVRLEHRRYQDLVRVLEKRQAVHSQQARFERFRSAHGASDSTRRFRVVER
jgi:sensor domain CHASE-containing protein